MAVDDLLIGTQFDDFGLGRVFERIAQQVEDGCQQQIFFAGDVGQTPGRAGDRGHDHAVFGPGSRRCVLDGLVDETVEIDSGVFDDASLDIGELAQVGQEACDSPGGDVDLLGRGFDFGDGPALANDVADARGRGAQSGEGILQLMVQADEHPVAFGQGILAGRGLDRFPQRSLTLAQIPPGEEGSDRQARQHEEQQKQEQPDLDLEDQKVRHRVL